MKDFEELISVIESEALTETEKVEKVEAILSENPELVNARDRINEPMLHCASIKGSLEIVKLSLEYGANVNYQGAYDDTALNEAIIHRHRCIAKYLISVKGINLNLTNKEKKHLYILQHFTEI